MKINWGTGVVLAFLAFISFILYFVIRMNSENRAKHDLVTEEYYKAELGYQKELNDATNAYKLTNKLVLEKTEDGLLIEFPKDQDFNKITGNVSLYRPSNKQLDFNLPISLSKTHLLIPDKRLLDGRWDIKITWQYNKEEYLHKQSITY
ncbi:FixH family protein [Cellulophaga sp. 20_2_10]|uniref:FixH family protein n=1 Tax=Cellulophaga sp. 20_2_10 TaxID=2942476 RepID=UPI00201A3B75|nr:FixH family protein [Cellulophaga sp. 20_2_10]MCL5244983.1 FixH family protein [Cellulophaga sp. 20_2_10]